MFEAGTSFSKTTPCSRPTFTSVTMKIRRNERQLVSWLHFNTVNVSTGLLDLLFLSSPSALFSHYFFYWISYKILCTTSPYSSSPFFPTVLYSLTYPPYFSPHPTPHP